MYGATGGATAAALPSGGILFLPGAGIGTGTGAVIGGAAGLLAGLLFCPADEDTKEFCRLKPESSYPGYCVYECNDGVIFIKQSFSPAPEPCPAIWPHP